MTSNESRTGTTSTARLETLAAYARLGADLGWRWPGAGRHTLGSYADEHDIALFERGQRVPVWILMRDLGCGRDALSRALKGLDRQGFIWRRTGQMSLRDDSCGNGSNCKFASISPEGEDWLKRQ